LCFKLRRNPRTVMVKHAHAKAQCTSSNRLPDTAHADDAQRRAVYIHTEKAIVAPLLPHAGAQPALGLRYAPRGGHQQRPREIRGGLIEHIGCVRAEYAGTIERIHIEVVVANGHVRGHLQPRRGGQHGRVDAVTGGQCTVLVSQARDQLVAREHAIVEIHVDVEILLERLEHQHACGPSNEAKKARHAYAARLGNRLDHKIRRVADIRVRAHEHRTGGNRRECRRAGRHQRVRIATRHVEEHQVCRRIIEKRRQQPGRPEVHWYGSLRLAHHPLHRGGERAALAGVEHRNHRRNRHEDTGKELRHLADRRPVEPVAVARRARRHAQRHEQHNEQAGVAHHTLQLDRHAQDRELHVRRPDAAHQHQRNDAAEQPEIYLAIDLDTTRVLRPIDGRRPRFAVAPEIIAVQHVEHREHHGAHEQRGQRQVHGSPEKIDAVQKAEEQWRVAERRQRTARIGDEENKEHHHMRNMAAIVIGSQQRPNQQHRRAGGPHHACEQRTQRDQARIERRRSMQIATYADTAGNRIQRGQQHDEGHVLGNHRMRERCERCIHAERHGERNQERKRPGRRHLAEMAVPERCGQQRQQRDRQQYAGKRHSPVQTQSRTLDFGCACGKRGTGEQHARQWNGKKPRHR
ncbi:hypothetical protein DFQ30_002304, partial [Apophysomyces sp. BC1015]